MNEWDNINPTVKAVFQTLARELRKTKEDFADRIEKDHNIATSITDGEADQDGTHKQLTLSPMSQDDFDTEMIEEEGAGKVYTKRDPRTDIKNDDESLLVTKLFYLNDAPSTVEQYQYSVCDMHRNSLYKTLSQCSPMLDGVAGKGVSTNGLSWAYVIDYTDYYLIHTNPSAISNSYYPIKFNTSHGFLDERVTSYDFVNLKNLPESYFVADGDGEYLLFFGNSMQTTSPVSPSSYLNYQVHKNGELILSGRPYVNIVIFLEENDILTFGIHTDETNTARYFCFNDLYLVIKRMR